MIHALSFHKDWIDSHRQRPGFEKINPPLAEKMIHALALVERLASSKLDFVFKGGTSLILLLDSPGRFSIDIDIITQAERTTIENKLSEICLGQPFTRFSLNEQRSYQPGIPKAHYSLYYQSALTGKEDHILLDVLVDAHTYPALLEKPVLTQWLKSEGESVLVRVPTAESITGDKLTAFAPNTTGIQYSRGKELEIVKQLFDLGRLFHEIKQIENVAIAFYKTVEKEINYRSGNYNADQVLDDIVQTGLLIARREKNKSEPDLTNFKEIQLGLLQLKTYQMSAFFRIEDAITASAKAAYMAAMIKTGAMGTPLLFNQNNDKNEPKITHPNYNYLNKVRPEALFYWSQTLKILEYLS